MTLSPKARFANLAATVALVLLIFLCLAWELWLAPLRPGGSFLSLKALPLLIPLFGLLHGRRYTHQWTSLLILAYFAEGVVRATTDHGASALLAIIEISLSIVVFAGCIEFARRTANRSA
ncbi:MAG TPA: DUF2069 domain-containing protein [Rhodocyclaceae bacterium]|nr:DUF2069 domain-containing protein [Rhodocyclaceae bacterium]HNH35407.1 DUF2069 domain-containing protein [Rhodocyclaceae bacterium]